MLRQRRVPIWHALSARSTRRVSERDEVLRLADAIAVTCPESQNRTSQGGTQMAPGALYAPTDLKGNARLAD